jgi:hypothetical protein
MLPTNATPLNERAIQELIAAHQAEIRLCFVPRTGGGRIAPGAWLLRLTSPWRRAGEPSPYQRTVLHGRDGA